MADTSSTTSARLGRMPADPEAVRFLQGRVALLALGLVAISGTFLVVTWVAYAAGTTSGNDSMLGRAAHAAGVAVVFVAWLVARRRRPLSPVALTVLDGIIVIGACLSWSMMGLGFDNVTGVYTAILASTFTCIGRAILVPTTLGRTLWTTGLALAPLPFVAALATPPPEVAQGSYFVMTQAIVWAASGLAISAITSRVIYGLHEQVREARELGQYVLEKKIGEGGMGEVYRARHTMLRRPTAVKLLSGTARPSDLRRFEREVQLTSELTHPNTIVVYDYGHTPDGVFYYAMEYLDGMDLATLVRRAGPLPAARVVHLLKQVCAALGEAHGVGLIHRDVKPENVVVGTRGGIHDFVKVLDFGLVKEVSQESDAGITAEGTIAGTPYYLPPEAIRGDQVDARSDLYSVGCLGYFLLTGTPVFDAKTVVEVCAAHLHQEPEPPSRRRPDVPADLEACLLACLEKSPADRTESAEALAAELVSCACADGWDAERARTWWEGASAPVVDEPELGEAPTLTAVDVDIARRADG